MNVPLIVASAAFLLLLPQFNNADAAGPYDGEWTRTATVLVSSRESSGYVWNSSRRVTKVSTLDTIVRSSRLDYAESRVPHAGIQVRSTWQSKQPASR